MREKVPSTGTVAVVVEPGAEDEVGCYAEEKAVDKLVIWSTQKKEYADESEGRRGRKAYIIINQVKNPQRLLDDCSSFLFFR